MLLARTVTEFRIDVRMRTKFIRKMIILEVFTDGCLYRLAALQYHAVFVKPLSDQKHQSTEDALRRRRERERERRARCQTSTRV